MSEFFDYWKAVILSKNYACLRKSAKLLFQYMLLESQMSSTGVFEFPLEKQKKYGLSDNGQFYLDREELKDNGFINVVYWGKTDRKCNLYMISDEWKNKTQKNTNIDCGYLYVIEVDGNYKIGISKNVKKRFGEYTKMAVEPKVIILEYCKKYAILEKDLHKKYEDKNVRGEWFRLNEKDINDIRTYIQPYLTAKM